MCELLKDQYKIYGAGMKPIKASGTWFNRPSITCYAKLADKYGLYVSHLQNVTADTK